MYHEIQPCCGCDWNPSHTLGTGLDLQDIKQVDSQLDRFEDVAAIVMVAANHFFSLQLITAMGN